MVEILLVELRGKVSALFQDLEVSVAAGSAAYLHQVAGLLSLTASFQDLEESVAGTAVNLHWGAGLLSPKVSSYISQLDTGPLQGLQNVV